MWAGEHESPKTKKKVQMEPFTTLKSRIVPLPRADVDTDQIIPARYLKATVKTGLGEGLFADWKCDEKGILDPEFPLNRDACRGANVLLADENFGCGSSREHAVWALMDWGIQSVLAPSFADIFRNNAFKNGLLPIELPQESITELFHTLESNERAEVVINLENSTVALPSGELVPFQIDEFARYTLMNGMDQLDFLLSQEARIEDYEKRHRKLAA
jgi:3-isopropylmalate/(R)-2-methylmalate dehydratase small subunit